MIRLFLHFCCLFSFRLSRKTEKFELLLCVKLIKITYTKFIVVAALFFQFFSALEIGVRKISQGRIEEFEARFHG